MRTAYDAHGVWSFSEWEHLYKDRHPGGPVRRHLFSKIEAWV